MVNHSISPEWKEGFTWAFDVPPKGQKLHILCKSKNTFGKVIRYPNYALSTFTAVDKAFHLVVAIINLVLVYLQLRNSLIILEMHKLLVTEKHLHMLVLICYTVVSQLLE